MTDASDIHLRDLVTAPAGSGKTVQLVRRYLHELRAGVSPEQIVAITFTRKSAADLVGRIGSILRFVALGGPEPKDIRLYLPFAPDAATCRFALASLPNAPVSTVDSFVFRLVQEFLLDARHALPDGTFVALDGPLAPSTSSSPLFEEAARDALEALGPDGRVNPAALLLLAEVRLSDAITDVARLARLATARMEGNAALLRAAPQTVTRDAGFWLAAEKALDRSPEALAGLRAWDGDPATTPAALLTVFDEAPKNSPLVDQRRTFVAATILALGMTPPAGDSDPFGGWSAAHGWVANAAPDRADAVRQAAWSLSRTARGIALGRMAADAAADHGELLRVATRLCRDAAAGESESAARLQGRFSVLMVDEVQDTNPDQLELYDAFRAMSSGIRSFYVGDLRQSIYRFRDGDPHGWAGLVLATAPDRQGNLTVNYRSSKRLVAFQKEVFGRLRTLGEHGVDDLDGLEAAQHAPEGARTGEVDERPVLVVAGQPKDPLEPRVIAAFARRLGAHWQTLGDPTFAPGAPAKESAAVLVTGWNTADWAAKELGKHGILARVTGDRSLLSGRVATDVRLLLRALLDPTDDIAWLGLLKHPSIGIRDACFPLVMPVGRLFVPAGKTIPSPEMLVGLHEKDAERLRHAMPILASARRRLGQEPTAGLLEEVVTLLGWRPIISAGPEGDAGVAELDILIDVCRAAEADTVDPRRVLDALVPGDEGAAELPKLRFVHDGPVVEVTTIFSAKGLEYDHVCVLQVGEVGSNGVRPGSVVQEIRAGGGSYLGVRLDPAGALDAHADPLGALATAVGKCEGRDEGLRLFYVAVTRATSTLTFGVGPGGGKNLCPVLRKALQIGKTPPDVQSEHTRILRPSVDGDAELLKPGASQPAVRARSSGIEGPQCLWVEPIGAVVRSPSSWAASRGKTAKAALIQRYRDTVRVVPGPKAPRLPLPAGLDERTVGTLIHGWLERWAFTGEPDPESAAAYLKERWNHDDEPLAVALCALGAHLLTALPEFEQMVRTAARLRFEVPLLAIPPARSGESDSPGDEVLVGSADLLVDHTDGSVTIVDFKAGAHSASVEIDAPTAEDELADERAHVPGLSGYAWQLEAYRRALVASGRVVREVGLLYVRGPSWARWG